MPPGIQRTPAYLTEDHLNLILRRILNEDVGTGDITSQSIIPAHQKGCAGLLMRESGVISGITAAEMIFQLVHPGIQCTWDFQDGDSVPEPAQVGTVSGPLQPILTAERAALNLMQRMTGIATATAAMVDRVKKYPTQIRDTRKTAPLLRLLDKWAVLLGGGINHRIGLYDRILIKDNHIAAARGLAKSVQIAAHNKPDVPIDVEARTLPEVREALTVSEYIDVLLLDNMTTYNQDGTLDCSLLKQAVDCISNRIKTEATGGITLETAPLIAATGVDYLSCGELTHSVRAVDISMRLDS